MAHGLLCRHCGHEEVPHSNWALLAGTHPDYETRAQDGYECTIATCPGFEYTDADAAEAHEIEARQYEHQSWNP